MQEQAKYEFGEFIFDCATGEMQRNGYPVRMPDQVARLLSHLLKADGTLVTREEIRNTLWGANEHLDFDLSINKAAYQLRLILRDSRHAPRFLETIPKRGYRFRNAHCLIVNPALQSFSDAHEPQSLASSSPQPKNGPQPDIEVHEPAQRSSAYTRLWQRVPRKTLYVVLGCLTVLVGIIVFGNWRHGRLKPVVPVKIGIAIAPFEVVGDAGDMHLESLRLALADAISQLPEVQVRAVHSLTATHVDVNEIPALAKKLQTDFFIFSHLTLDKRNFNLQMEVIRGSDASHLTSLVYEGTKPELFALRERVQRELFQRLSLAQNTQTQHALGSTSNPAAYEAYLQGRAFLEQRDDDALRRSYAAFERAASADPHFSEAYAGMAHAELLLTEHDTIPAAIGYQKARKLTEKALAEKPDLAEAHALIGFIAFRLDWNFATADNELRAAINLDSSVPIYHVLYAVVLYDQSRFDESYREVEAAHNLEPLWAPIYLTEATLEAGAHDYTRMLTASQKLVEMMPGWSLAHDQLGWSYWYMGRSEDAISEWRRMAELENDTAMEEFEREGLDIFRHGGRLAYARYCLTASLHGNFATHRHDFVPAEWSAYAGEKEQALQLLRQEVDHHTIYALRTGTLPPFFAYHDDPKFQALLLRIGLPLPSHRPGLN